MNKTYLIYRPVLDYEESMVPLLCVITKERAEIVRREMIDWCISTEKSLPQINRDDYEDAGEGFSDQRYDAVMALKGGFPYDCDALHEVFNRYFEGFDHQPESFLSIMELDLVTFPESKIESYHNSRSGQPHHG